MIIDIGRARIQAGSCRPVTTKARVRSQVCTCGICGGHSCTGTGVFLRLLRFSFINSTPYSFI